MAMTDKISIIGAGLMGRPLAERVLKAGYDLTVYNRTAEKASSLRDIGAKSAESPVEAIVNSDCIILMLSDYEAIRRVLFHSDSFRALSDRTIIQMGTISPGQSLSLLEDIREQGGDYFEAPVLGSVPEAREGKLILMVGSSSEQHERWSGLLRCFGPEAVIVGQVGQAAALKLAMNHLIAGLTSVFSLSLAFVQKNGISTDCFMNILRASALYAPTFDKKLRRMVERDFSDPNFPTKHLAKDTGLFANAAHELNLDTSGLAGIRRIIERALEQGEGEKDYSAIHNIIDPED